MKKIVLVFFLFFLLHAQSQNVGLGTTTPQSKLQINHRTTPSSRGIGLIDSASSSAGSIEFRNVDRTRKMTMGGYSPTDAVSDQYLDIYSDTAFVATFRGNGMVGISNGGPQYPLDVIGDINTNGVLRANGNGGINGQVLMSNGNGTMTWGDFGDYKNFVSLQSSSLTSWTVPAGVTRILIEAWGAGGGGNTLVAGGSGGYIRAFFIVAPGTLIDYVTGVGGGGSVAANGVSGSSTQFSVTGTTCTAGGGFGGLYFAANDAQGGLPGGYSASVGFTNYAGVAGEPGGNQVRNYFQVNSTTYYESGQGGRGGNAPFYQNGGRGSYYVYNVTGAAGVLRNVVGTAGQVPGGGGAGGIQYGPTNYSGGNGASGLIIVRY